MYICYDVESALTLENLKEFQKVIRHFVNFLQRQKFQRIMKIRQDQANLPIYQYKHEILSAVRENQVVLIAGDTGCGKSTQVSKRFYSYYYYCHRYLNIF